MFQSIGDGWKNYNAKKEAQNKAILAQQQAALDAGQTPNDFLDALGHGLRGKHANALFLLHDSRKEIAELIGGKTEEQQRKPSPKGWQRIFR